MEKEREPQARLPRPTRETLRLEPLVLASASPRRAEILRAVGWRFAAQPADVDESLIEGESPVKYVERLARAKAERVAARLDSGLTLGADTIVVAGGQTLGKPRDAADARRMLRSLSGGWHEVLTGVALVRRLAGATKSVVVAHETTRVRFAEISDDEIDEYIATGEPMDKAGAYAVQGRAALFIKEIAGDYWNVVGLPAHLVYSLAQTVSPGAV